MDSPFLIQTVQAIKPALPITEEAQLDWDMHTFRSSKQPQGFARRTLIGWDFGNYVDELTHKGNANAVALLLLVLLNVQQDGWSYFMPGELVRLTGLTSKKVDDALAFLCKKCLSCSTTPVLRAVRFLHNQQPSYTAYTAYPHATPVPSILSAEYVPQQ